MNVIRNPLTTGWRLQGGCSLTVGVFDGVHRGQLEVIDSLKRIKESEGTANSVLLTFDCHPLTVTHPDRVPPLLTTLEEKLSLLKDMEIDTVLVEEFTEEIAKLGYRAFINEHLVGNLSMEQLVVGYDFHLGRAREGTQERLIALGREVGFGVTIVPPVVMGGRVVSSTKIRKAVSDGDLGIAARFLSRPYFLDSKVVRGEGLGRRLDFPTANLSVPGQGKLLPPEGVYAVHVDVDGQTYGGMMNIGSSPTLHSDGERRMEVHLFDFSGDIYGMKIRVKLLEFVREEMKFEHVSDLKVQLMKDRENILWILEKKH